jgi:hypothetical protein
MGSQTDDVRTRPFRDSHLHHSRIPAPTTASLSTLSIAFAFDPLALITALLYALLLNHHILSPLPYPKIGTARSHAPFSVLPAYQDDLALAIIAPVATQAHHQAATRDLLDVKDMQTGTFRGAQGIRKHACFV